VRLSEARREYFRRRAREEGYLSRAAYKLIQIDDKYRFLSKGAKVLDLGCAPGGWSQVASARVTDKGLVVGVDLSPVSFKARNYLFVKGDISSPQTLQLIRESSSSFDCVLSDLSPKLMGVWDADSSRQVALASEALDITKLFLRGGGTAVFKLFQGETTNEFIGEAKKLFQRVVISKPPASRKQASEIYLVCLGLLADKFAADKEL
jgi:23S rRNA (uridine2552-2'-O)-methyltransferase